MKIIAINASGQGQIADFMHSIGKRASTNGITYLYAVGTHGNKTYHDFVIQSCSLIRLISKTKAKFSGDFDDDFKFGTKRLIRWIDKQKPDIVHIHNLHGGYIHVSMLIHYLKEKGIPVVFTLHDTWLFTGKCLQFEDVHCIKWKKICKDCPKEKEEPKWLYGEHSTRNFLKKKELFTSLDHVAFVATYGWMKEMASISFLKSKKIYSVYKGVDLSIFYPRETSFKKKRRLESFKIILCYAREWTKEKGLTTINHLANILKAPYKIVVLNAPRRKVSKRAIAIPHVKSINALAEYFASSDMFLNLSADDLFPVENLYALASGIPVFTFSIGGTPEQINDYVGRIVSNEDPVKIRKEIEAFFEKTIDYQKNCLKRAEEFSFETTFQQYLAIYDNIIKKKE